MFATGSSQAFAAHGGAGPGAYPPEDPIDEFGDGAPSLGMLVLIRPAPSLAAPP